MAIPAWVIVYKQSVHINWVQLKAGFNIAINARRSNVAGIFLLLIVVVGVVRSRVNDVS